MNMVPRMGDSGPLVVCAPGMGDLRGEYRFLAPQLVAAGYRAVAFDVRGHGESSVSWDDYSVAGIGADMLAFVRALGSSPAYLVGTSMAGGAAVWAAAEAPELVAGVVLINPFVQDGGGSRQLTNLLLGTLFARPWGPAVWMRYIASLYPTARPDDFQNYMRRLGASLREPGRFTALRRMLLASKAASAERLTQVKAPALIVMGTRDRDFKDPAGEARLRRRKSDPGRHQDSAHRRSRSLSACRNACHDGTCSGQLSPGTAAGSAPWPVAGLEPVSTRRQCCGPEPSWWMPKGGMR